MAHGFNDDKSISEISGMFTTLNNVAMATPKNNSCNTSHYKEQVKDEYGGWHEDSSNYQVWQSSTDYPTKRIRFGTNVINSYTEIMYNECTKLATLSFDLSQNSSGTVTELLKFPLIPLNISRHIDTGDSPDYRVYLQNMNIYVPITLAETSDGVTEYKIIPGYLTYDRSNDCGLLRLNSTMSERGESMSSRKFKGSAAFFAEKI